MARRGAARASRESASEKWRTAATGAPTGATAHGVPGSRWEPEEWVDEGELRDEATQAIGRSRQAGSADDAGAPRRRGGPGRGQAGAGVRRATAGRAGGGAPRPEIARDELRGAVGPERVRSFETGFSEAVDAFRRERYEDARRLLRPLVEQAPRLADGREIYGLTLYRLGRWRQAARELEAFRELSGNTEQHPVLADCYRALGRHDKVDELWAELRAASPGAALVTEGRIVTAGAMADRGRLRDAIRLLEEGRRPVKRPKEHHLRLAYALADLYERAGDLPRARELFTRVAAGDPDFVDVQARLHALR